MYESEVSKRFLTALKKYCKAVVFKVHGHTMQQPGIPDFYLAINGFSGWIETKGPATKITPLQRTVIGTLKELEVPVYVLRFMTDRYFVFEDENGSILTGFTFSNWEECIQAFLKNLFTLEYVRKNKVSIVQQLNAQQFNNSN